MTRYKQSWKRIIQRAVEEEAGTPVDADTVIIENPPRAELGDLAFPMFPYASILKRSSSTSLKFWANADEGRSEPHVRCFLFLRAQILI